MTNPIIGYKWFRISYIDPKTLETVTIEKAFDATPNIDAAMWAEDWAYAAADKGWHEVTPIKAPRSA